MSDPSETAKYLLFGNEPPVNLFLLLDVIYTGLSVVVDAGAGVATLECAPKNFCEQVPATLTGTAAGQLSKPSAVALAIECCRAGGVGGFCYAWTRRDQPIFREIVEAVGPAFGLWDWQLAQAWRFERADVHEDVAYLLLSFSAALPSAPAQQKVVDILFKEPWVLTSQQARTLGAVAAKLQIYAVLCERDNARLLVCDTPFYITQRDWSVLALLMLFTEDGDGIAVIEGARRLMDLVE